MSERFILIGHPVKQSVSPVIHHAAYQQMSFDAHYGLVDCADEAEVQVQVEAIRRGELRGANVTVPWKRVAFESADELDESARRVGVANVLARAESGKIVAYNTDAIGLAAELRRASASVEKEQRPGALIIGSGGATRASVVACQLNGVNRVAVTARRFDPAVPQSEWPNAQAFLDLGAELLPWPTFDHAVACSAFLSSSHLVLQATSAGMKGVPGGEVLAELFPWSAFKAGLAYDLVYNPPQTPFLKRAAEEGHVAEGGLGMLVGQAAYAIRIWTGTLPEQGPLLAAAKRALGL